LDYFDARYFSAAQGRFTSPDWSAVPRSVPYANFADPQTLNLYAYVRNNPLGRADAYGHSPLTCKDHPELCRAIRDSVSNGTGIEGGYAAAFSTGALLWSDANVRAAYVARAKGALTEKGEWSAVRAGARVDARASQSGIAQGITAIADQASSGPGGFTATSTRSGINALAEDARGVGAGLMAVGVALSVYDVATAPEGQKARTAAGEVGSLAVGAGGAWAVAGTGAAIGSVFGPVGTLVGGIAGGLVGGFAGGWAGHDIGTQAYDDIVH